MWLWLTLKFERSSNLNEATKHKYAPHWKSLHAENNGSVFLSGGWRSGKHKDIKVSLSWGHILMRRILIWSQNIYYWNLSHQILQHICMPYPLWIYGNYQIQINQPHTFSPKKRLTNHIIWLLLSIKRQTKTNPCGCDIVRWERQKTHHKPILFGEKCFSLWKRKKN